MALELREQRVGHATVALDESIRVGEHHSLDVTELVRRRPARDRADLVLAHPEGATGLAVLGEDELATSQPPGPRLSELAQHRVEHPSGAVVEAEATHGVAQDGG